MNASRIKSLVKKELSGYFNSPIAYIFMVVFLVVTNWLFFQNFFLIGQASLRGMFTLLPFTLVFLVPVVAMRIWSEERARGTIEILLTLPVRISEVVWAKYLASLGFLVFCIGLTLTLPLSVAYLGKIDWGVVLAGYIGSIFLCSVYLGVGMFFSALTKNQIVALIVSFFVSLSFYLLGSSIILDQLPLNAGRVVSFMSTNSHFDSLARGVIFLPDIIYFVSVAGLFLFLNVLFLKKEKVN